MPRTALAELLSAHSLPSLHDGMAQCPPSQSLSAWAGPISCKGLTRLDYALLQTMLRLAPWHSFSELDHLQPLLERYGVSALLPRAAGESN